MSLFAVVPLFIGVVFVLVIGTFVFAAIRGIGQWSYNNAQPVLTSPAKVVTKRTNVWGGSGDSSANTSYYVTFELPTGERREVGVNGRDYGQLAEGDEGDFTYQGTRYKGFLRRS